MKNIAFNDVEIFLRINGRLPEHSADTLHKSDYKLYCDMVMKGKKCFRGRIYKHDGLWGYSWDMYKSL